MENEVKVTIVVTGFGPFGKFKENASWEAVKLLPELFIKWEKCCNVNLIVQEIPVAYYNVECIVKSLWDKHKPSLLVHVGVSNSIDCFAIERHANSKGYIRPDIYDKYPKEDNSPHITLKTNFNIEDICATVNKYSNETGCKVCISDDAGRYLCEYIYYQSLKIGNPEVLFIHVPHLDIYSSERTAQGLLKILIYLIECVFEQKYNKK